jgi:hypothetical protein
MSPFSADTARRARHLLLGAAILSATVLACFPMAPDAHAATGACRSEPVVILSNGYALDMNATIQDDASDVQSVNYTVNIPSGVSVVGTPVDDAVLGVKDHYSFSSNGPAGSYSVGVTANTGTKVSMSATTDLVNGKKAHVSSDSASGNSNSQLWMRVSG